MLTATTRHHRLQRRISTLACWQGTALALLLATTGVLAQAATRPASQAANTTKPQAIMAKAGKVAKPANTRQKLKNEASGLALATETAETINEIQLAIAARVLTGSADCEFNQRISVLPLAGKDGFFTVTHFTAPQKSQHYTMAPRETATGAVRLEDKLAGVVWLQIPSKSMLMNSRAGQRMVDSCLHAEQRSTVFAAASAAQGQGLGIVAPAPAVVVVVPTVVAAAVAAPDVAIPAAATLAAAYAASAAAAAAAAETAAETAAAAAAATSTEPPAADSAPTPAMAARPAADSPAVPASATR